MKTILVAEDHSSVRALLRVILEAEGYRVVEAPDGTDVLELAERRNPALILLDLMMPGLDGERVIPMLRESPALSDVPVVVVTAKVDALSRIEGILGAENVFSKPFDDQALIARVTELIGPATKPPPATGTRRG